jgi:hypothetical protein
MSEFNLNQSLSVEKIQHEDPEISVYVIDNFLDNPITLCDYASNKAYFSQVGEDGTAYPGIRDRLPRPYERVMEKVIELTYSSSPIIHRCMMSLTTLQPQQLSTAQKIPHVDALGDDQFAAVHYLCGPPHGGTAIYRYRPRNLVRLRTSDHQLVEEMLQEVRARPEEHAGYITGDTSLFKQELHIEAKFNRLVLYPSNLLHCAQLSARDSLVSDISKGRLSVASFFKLA